MGLKHYEWNNKNNNQTKRLEAPYIKLKMENLNTACIISADTLMETSLKAFGTKIIHTSFVTASISSLETSQLDDIKTDTELTHPGVGCPARLHVSD